MMKLKEFQTKTPLKRKNKTYVIGNAERERELEKQLFEISEEVRQARLDLAELGALRKQYAEQGAELNVFRRKAKISDNLAEQVENMEKRIQAMVEAEDNRKQNTSTTKV
jgi:hypothetical protein